MDCFSIGSADQPSADAFLISVDYILSNTLGDCSSILPLGSCCMSHLRGGSDGKETVYNAGDPSSISG